MKPTLAQVIRAALDARLMDVHVSMPGIVQSYDSGSRRASVQPCIQRIGVGEDGGRVLERLPVILNAPVAFQSAGDYEATFPIEAGAQVWIVISEACLDQWLDSGVEGDPRNPRRFNLGDAMVIPGCRAGSDLPDAPGDSWCIRAPKIQLGSKDADQPPVLKAALDKFMVAIQSAINSLASASQPNTELTALQTALASGGTTWTLGGLAGKVLVE